MSHYIPGDRLWVRLEGYDWWPARVLSDEDIAAKMNGQAREPGCDLAVLFYPGTQSPESFAQLNSTAEERNICYFETSSEKAVTDNEDLRRAIATATSDASSNPLKEDPAPAAFVSGGAAASSAAAARRPAKRARAGSDSDSEAGDVDRAAPAAGSTSKGFKQLSAVELVDLAARINRAVAENDVPSLRIELCSLDRVDVSRRELEKTKIGVAVGGILGSTACEGLWPLARALISFWARHLDEATLAAVRRVKEADRPTDIGILPPASPGPGSPTSPSFGARLTTFGSPTRATGSTANTFFGMVTKLLNSPDNVTPVSTATVEKVAKELSATIKHSDDRSELLQRLSNPDLAFVRENLLSGKWTAKMYLEEPDEVFRTEKERAAEEARMREKMAAYDNALMAGVNVTELFKCSNCGSRKCSFHEQQTRGADEPTTKFITCLKCKKAWTEE